MDTNAVEALATAAAAGLALYAGHHVGDYWVQTNHQAATKGCAGHAGRMACLAHVATYTATQAVCLGLLILATGWSPNGLVLLLALLVSGGTHYAADRREHGLMFKLAQWLEPRTGKATFGRLGVPRAGKDDNPHLATGNWALDQSWHILLGVFIPALILAAAA